MGPVSQRAVFPPRARSERAAAWVVTGPVGHLLAFLADVAIAWLTWARGALGRQDGIELRIGGRTAPAFADDDLLITGRASTTVRVRR